MPGPVPSVGLSSAAAEALTATAWRSGASAPAPRFTATVPRTRTVTRVGANPAENDTSLAFIRAPLRRPICIAAARARSAYSALDRCRGFDEPSSSTAASNSRG